MSSEVREVHPLVEEPRKRSIFLRRRNGLDRRLRERCGARQGQQRDEEKDMLSSHVHGRTSLGHRGDFLQARNGPFDVLSSARAVVISSGQRHGQGVRILLDPFALSLTPSPARRTIAT